MKILLNRKGFTLIEVIVATAIFVLFAVGIYGGITLIFKIVYQSRTRILETGILAEQLEVVRNLPYDSVGIISGVPAGVLPHTTTTVRNGEIFTLITTIRNIDDPFDGTASGTPHDLSPADFKLVEMSAICQNCLQQASVILSTIVAPKQLEGASVNGALFIQVFDADGLPVAGADVSVTNTARTPLIIVNDTTGNDGYLRIIDTTTGTRSYYINVSKPGYSTDYTVVSGPSAPTPIKPPANVVSQDVTDISFSIDRLSNLTLHTINTACAALGSVRLNMSGAKKIAIDPDIYKFNKNFTTDASGNYSFPNIEWDTYFLSTTGTISYDVAGAMPMLPLAINPGLTQDAKVILQAHTANSLLVNVVDAGTGLPLSDATVELTGTSYDVTVLTGYGYTRQTDWSSGSGQINFTNPKKYFADSGTVNYSSYPGDLKLKKSGLYYANNGWLESSTFDLGTQVNFNNIIFKYSAQTQCGANPVTFQFASSNTSTPSSWSYKGPDGTAGTFYTATNTLIWSGNDNNRYFRYKVFLNTSSTSYTPTLSEVAFTFSTSCTPPGQVFFSGLSVDTYTLDVSRSGYTTNNGTIDISGNGSTLVNMSPSS
ncbi:MAG: prepilin-type N-terminal cleavage/methylation domain-containing protein [Patescibacteria group bacterium]